MKKLARPPEAGTPGGLARVQRMVRTPIVAIGIGALGVAALGRATPVGAQVIRGTIRTQEREALVPNAMVVALDSAGVTIREVMTDSFGRFILAVNHGKPFRVTVRKLGWLPSMTDYISGAPTDTLDFDLLVPSDPVKLTAVEVTAEADKSFNARGLDEARRRGWKLYPPTLVEQHRESTMNFNDLLRATGAQGLVLPTGGMGGGRESQECIRSNRTRRCLVFVVDGAVMGTSVYLNPRDVYFFAVLSSTESAVQWGDRAPWGAIVVYTRMNGDKKNP
jgi:hypothetical protein